MKQEFTDFHAAAIELASAYISTTDIEPERIPELLQIAYRAVLHMDAPPATIHALPPAKKPAVPIEKSVYDDYLICLEDGVHLKMLKRYLKTNYDMTFEQYRARWGLPKNYPAVAPNYTKQRSKMAKDRGLGRKKK